MALGKSDRGATVVPKGSHKGMDGFPHPQPAAIPGADKSSTLCLFQTLCLFYVKVGPGVRADALPVRDGQNGRGR